jgi:hypothetical protein
MSSNRAAKPLDAHGLALVRDVLRTAGLRGVDSDASSDIKRDASIFVTEIVRGGVHTKTSLLKALAGRDQSSTAYAGVSQALKIGAANRPQEKGDR